MLKFLIFGDIVGRIGREALIRALPRLRETYRPDLVLANAENLAHGKGVTPKVLRPLHDAGIDLFTSGNHVFSNQKVHEIWKDETLGDILIRPDNYPPGTPGEGRKIVKVGGKNVLVVNLLCQVFMPEEVSSPFEAADAALASPEAKDADIILIDLHGEATSERIAFGRYIDGRVTAVTGTHTHVPTADARILPNGTGYLTDIGMTGARDSVIGVEAEGPLSRFLDRDPVAFEIPKQGPVDLNAALVRTDAETGRTISVELVQEIIE